ncbi:MAG: hypothetical protein GKR94_27615 [Gammaproteobacteria bacterium]|nr:hypothetical protein [Gammaproteobacteria bacterium]
MAAKSDYSFLRITPRFSRRRRSGPPAAEGTKPRSGLAVGCKRLLGDDFVIFGMCANPEPVDTIFNIHTEGAIVISNPNRPQFPDFFEMKRRVARIGFKQ